MTQRQSRSRRTGAWFCLGFVSSPVTARVTAGSRGASGSAGHSRGANALYYADHPDPTIPRASPPSLFRRVFVADSGNDRVRCIAPDGVVSTLEAERGGGGGGEGGENAETPLRVAAFVTGPTGLFLDEVRDGVAHTDGPP